MGTLLRSGQEDSGSITNNAVPSHRPRLLEATHKWAIPLTDQETSVYLPTIGRSHPSILTEGSVIHMRQVEKAITAACLANMHRL